MSTTTAQTVAGYRDSPLGAKASPGRGEKRPYKKASEDQPKRDRRPKAAAGSVASGPAPDPREQLRAELRRWSLCKTFVHQFGLIVRPVPRASPEDKTTKRRKGGHGERRPWRSFRPFVKRMNGAEIREQPDGGGDNESAAIEAYYNAKIEATRRSLPRRDAAAAVRTLRDEQRAAMREITDRQRATRQLRRVSALSPERPDDEINTNLHELVA